MERREKNVKAGTVICRKITGRKHKIMVKTGKYLLEWMDRRIADTAAGR